MNQPLSGVCGVSSALSRGACSSGTVTTAVALMCWLSSSVPETVNVPGSAYADSSISSQVTVVFPVEPSAWCALTCQGRMGAVPAWVVTETRSTLVISRLGW